MAGPAADALCERTAGLMDTSQPDEDVLVTLDRARASVAALRRFAAAHPQVAIFLGHQPLAY